MNRAIFNLRCLAILGAMLSSSASRGLASPSLVYDTKTSAAVASIDSPDSWLSGGSGRFGIGNSPAPRAEIETAVTMTVRDHWSIYVQGHLFSQGQTVETDAAGLSECFLRWEQSFGAIHVVSCRLGVFLPASSMENIDSLWYSPYTLTWSTLNSWIADEIRLTGLELNWQVDATTDLQFGAGAAVFSGNDAAGTLLAWRGWSMGHRLSGIGETLPLPPMQALEDGQMFQAQDDAGTTPIESDLDDKPGWYGQLFCLSRSLGLLQLSSYDNKGDRLLYADEYSWRTRYLSAGFSSEPIANVDVLGEFMQGDTGMGPIDRPHVQVDFESWYLMVSTRWNRWRVSTRYESFSTTDIDRTRVALNADPNDEAGQAWTLAILYELNDHWRLGAEWVDMEVRRDEDLTEGSEGSADSQLVQLELTARF
jgi:hypothetical protein